MLQSSFAEDIFIHLVDLFDRGVLSLQSQHQGVIASFSKILNSGGQLTENQANFLIKILHQYKNLAKAEGFDYAECLTTPIWKKPFRLLDNTKLFFVEKTDDGEFFIGMKCPFKMKEAFEKEINAINVEYSASSWDPDRQIRKLKIYNFNLIEIYEFALKYKFEVDESFMECLANFEEIWQSSDDIVPRAEIINGSVRLINATESAKLFFEEKSKKNIPSDLLLAKSMGYPLEKTPENIIEKLAHREEKSFWIKNFDSLFEVYKQVGGPIAVMVGKSDKTDEWVKKFVNSAVASGINQEDIRICFRYDKDDNTGFNLWVKNSGYGGKVEGGKIFIFQNKPPKWLFSNEINVKMIITNSLYPIPNSVTQSWMDSHPLVIYVGDIKATNMRDEKIVEL